MKANYFMGIDVGAFKKFYRADKKTNTQMKAKNCCYWAEQNGNSYFCNGIMIIRFESVPLAKLASVFDLAFDDMPNDDRPALDLAQIYNEFRLVDYNPAVISKWYYDGKKKRVFRLVAGESAYCILDDKFVIPFAGNSAVGVKSDLNGAVFTWGDYMTAFVLPIKPAERDRPIYEAIRGHVWESKGGKKD